MPEKYIIVGASESSDSYAADGLVDMVNEYMEDGYIPSGTPFMDNDMLCQAMVLKHA